MYEFYSLPKSIKAFIIVTFALLIYGYLSRTLNLFFFWESRPIGWGLGFFVIILLLSHRIFLKRSQNRKIIPEKIAIFLIALFLISEIARLIIIPETAACKTAISYIKSNQTNIEEIGEINNIILLPKGNFSTSGDETGLSSQADLYFIIKGQNKFKEIKVQLIKENNSVWTTLN